MTDRPDDPTFYEATFIDEPSVEDKLAALDRLTEPACLRWSLLDVVIFVLSAVAALGWAYFAFGVYLEASR